LGREHSQGLTDIIGTEYLRVITCGDHEEHAILVRNKVESLAVQILPALAA
jgi:hypothetical protein